jgi:hypothetical protein
MLQVYAKKHAPSEPLAQASG